MTTTPERRSPAWRAALEGQRDLLVLAGLWLLCLAIYRQASAFDFVSFDDGLYVFENPHVLAGLTRDGVRWAFTTFDAANWHPLTWLSLMIDTSIGGPGPGPHHFGNVALHFVNGAVLFYFLRQATSRFWPSAVVAALFVVHPAHVESVAWIAERKDVLSTAGWLFTMWAYLWWTRRPTAPRYALVVVALALGLMAKPMLVTMPVVLLLCDVWPLGRVQLPERAGGWWRALAPRIVEKWPLFVLVAAASVMTVLAQRQGGAVQSLQSLSLTVRLMNVPIAVMTYLAMLVWPAGLAVWYPYDREPAAVIAAASAAALVAVTLAALRQRRARPYLAAGWLWFLVTLVPVIGLVQVGGQAYADRYTYIPYIGLFIAIAWTMDTSLERAGAAPRRAAIAVSLAAIAGCTVAAARQTSYWRTSDTLYERALAVTTGNYMVHHNYCNQLLREQRVEDAERECRAAVAVAPGYANALNSLGAVLMLRGKHEEARTYLEDAGRRAPAVSLIQVNLMKARTEAGDLDGAASAFRRALAIGPDDASSVDQLADFGLTIAGKYAAAGRTQDALDLARMAAPLRAMDVQRLSRAGTVYMQAGDAVSAERHFREVLRLAAPTAEARSNLGAALMRQGRYADAIAEFEAALALDPALAAARSNLATARRALGRSD